MSFSKSVKEEIIKKLSLKNNSESVLLGIFLSAGSLIISNRRLLFIISNENESVIMFAKEKIEKIFDCECTIVKVMKNFKGRERFELSVSNPDKSEEILLKLGIISKDNNGSVTFSNIDISLFKNKVESNDFLTGFFLGSGSVSIPVNDGIKKTYGYHFEIVVSTWSQAELISELFAGQDILPKVVERQERNEQYVVYLKKFDAICDALSLIGASKAVLDMTSANVDRTLNNDTNRQANFWTANMDKVMTASAKQMRAIEIIKNTVGLEKLPEELAETAQARLENPEGTLNDIIKKLGGNISKGAVSQRFNKIIKIADELGENDN